MCSTRLIAHRQLGAMYGKKAGLVEVQGKCFEIQILAFLPSSVNKLE